MTTKMAYSIRFVADMDKAVAFYRDVLGLPLRFQSMDWSEFITGETTLALHASSPQNPPGKVQLGFHVPDLQQFYEDLSARGIQFTQLPTQESGSLLARFIDFDGTECSVSQSM